jgi:hypothetical protein
MTTVVALIGVLIGGFGLYGMAQPARLIAWVKSVWSQDRLWLAVGIRLVLGALLIYAAPECRAPQAVRVLGVITLVAAVGLVFIGSKRMNAFVQWWTERPSAVVRAWSVAAVLLGAFLVYAGG